MNLYTKCVVFAAVLCLLCGTGLRGEELTVEKKAAIKELMDLSGEGQLAQTFTDALNEQLRESLRREHPNMPARAFDILAEETNATMKREFGPNGGYYEGVYPIYHKHFTLEEIRGIAAFYRSPLGRKAMRAMPMLMEESMEAGQKWRERLMPVLEKRVTARLEKEGLAPRTK